MYISTRHYRVEPENVDKIVRLAQEEYLPRAEQCPGFIAFFVLQPDSASVATVAVFESLADMEASSQTMSDWARANFAPLFPNPPHVTSGEVGAYRIRGAALTAGE